MSTKSHKLLDRQLRKSQLSMDQPPQSVQQWQEFLSRVGQAYIDNDRRRAQMEQSLFVSSRELSALVKQHQSNEEKISQLLQRLSETFTDLQDSISYAQRIQTSSLPRADEFHSVFSDFFCIWQPRDSVGGDFYWLHEKAKGVFLLAVADCVGHGVPGAFLAQASIALLHKIALTHENKHPGKILSQLNRELRSFLHQSDTGRRALDSLDVGLCICDLNNQSLSFAGANRPLLYTQNGEIKTIKGDRYSIGDFAVHHTFSSFQIDIPDAVKDPVTFYLLTDGYTDQKGGTKGIPFGSKRLRAYLSNLIDKPLSDQEHSLRLQYDQWRGSHEQLDDITVLGFRLHPSAAA